MLFWLPQNLFFVLSIFNKFGGSDIILPFISIYYIMQGVYAIEDFSHCRKDYKIKSNFSLHKFFIKLCSEAKLEPV